MIFKDTHASQDTDACPAKRPNECCLNCGKPWGFHDGWACRAHGVGSMFTTTTPTERYETASMRASIGGSVNAPRAIAGTVVGMAPDGGVYVTIGNVSTKVDYPKINPVPPPSRECPCGSARIDCDYHK
jgi:hypothetical protein